MSIENGKNILTSDIDREEYWAAFASLVVESLEIRHEQKMSQIDIANKMGTKQSVISRFENMGRSPNYDFLSRFALATGHVLGMTFYGEFMATVPVSKHNHIREIAKTLGKSTETVVSDLLGSAIEASIESLSSDRRFQLSTESSLICNCQNANISTNTQIIPSADILTVPYSHINCESEQSVNLLQNNDPLSKSKQFSLAA